SPSLTPTTVQSIQPGTQPTATTQQIAQQDTSAPPVATIVPPASSTPSASPTNTPVPPTALPVQAQCQVIANTLNLRSGPDTVYEPPIRALRQGTILNPLA